MRSVLLAVLALLGALIVPRSGRAWTEARPAGMVTEYQVDRDGGATVTVRIVDAGGESMTWSKRLTLR